MTEKNDLPNKIDRILEKWFLWAIPRFVTPNHITIIRFVSIPFVVYLLLIEEYRLALPLFALSAFTDALDGAVARVRNQITNWGRLFDPIADKTLIVSSLLILVANEVSLWLGILIVAIDVAIVSVVAYQYSRYKKILNPHWTGKAKMLSQSFGVGTLLLSMVWPVAIISWAAIGFLYLAVALGLASFLLYRSA